MSTKVEILPFLQREKRLNPFERYLSVWVALCIVVGMMIGKLLPNLTDSLRRMELGAGSEINIPIAVPFWWEGMISFRLDQIRFTLNLIISSVPHASTTSSTLAIEIQWG